MMGLRVEHMVDQLKNMSRLAGRARYHAIAVTIHDDDPFPVQLLEAGASGYITKGCDVKEIVEAIRTVHSGSQYITPGVAQKLALSLMKKEKLNIDEVMDYMKSYSQSMPDATPSLPCC